MRRQRFPREGHSFSKTQFSINSCWAVVAGSSTPWSLHDLPLGRSPNLPPLSQILLHPFFPPLARHPISTCRNVDKSHHPSSLPNSLSHCSSFLSSCAQRRSVSLLVPRETFFWLCPEVGSMVYLSLFCPFQCGYFSHSQMRRSCSDSPGFLSEGIVPRVAVDLVNPWRWVQEPPMPPSLTRTLNFPLARNLSHCKKQPELIFFIYYRISWNN